MKKTGKIGTTLGALVLALAGQGCNVAPKGEVDYAYSHLDSKIIEEGNPFANYSTRILDEEIPGASLVEEMPVDGALNTLIHIRQRHPSEEDTLEGKENLIRDNQQVYQIVKYLAEKRGIKNVYIEGVSREQESQLREVVESDLADYAQGSEDPGVVESLENIYLYQFGGAGKAALQRIVSLRPAEKEDSNNKAVAEMKKIMDGGEGDLEIIDRDREDALLDILLEDANSSNTASRVFVVQYGAAHDWTDNVQRLNSRYPNSPDKNFSLITITPKYIERDFKEDALTRRRILIRNFD